jgi:F420-dependent oxidoreductase-like protein
MKLGVHQINFDLPGGAGAIGSMLRDLGEAAEGAGLANLSVMDHYFQMEIAGGAAAAMLEGYTTMGFLAAATSTVELQLLVTGVTYRHPGLLAKIITTLDVISGGRAALGIGAAWYEEEHVGLGVPFPPLTERYERLEETIEIVRQMWSDDDGPYVGRHYNLGATINVPQPLRPGGIPIMIGGSGERKTLALVARHADACNLFAGDDVSEVARKLDVLRGHCEREGTDYDRIAKTIMWIGELDPAGASADAFVALMERYAAIGIVDAHIVPLTDDPVRFVDGLGTHIVPRLATL